MDHRVILWKCRSDHVTLLLKQTQQKYLSVASQNNSQNAHNIPYKVLRFPTLSGSSSSLPGFICLSLPPTATSFLTLQAHCCPLTPAGMLETKPLQFLFHLPGTVFSHLASQLTPTFFQSSQGLFSLWGSSVVVTRFLSEIRIRAGWFDYVWAYIGIRLW